MPAHTNAQIRDTITRRTGDRADAPPSPFNCLLELLQGAERRELHRLGAAHAKRVLDEARAAGLLDDITADEQQQILAGTSQYGQLAAAHQRAVMPDGSELPAWRPGDRVNFSTVVIGRSVTILCRADLLGLPRVDGVPVRLRDLRAARR